MQNQAASFLCTNIHAEAQAHIYARECIASKAAYVTFQYPVARTCTYSPRLEFVFLHLLLPFFLFLARGRLTGGSGEPNGIVIFSGLFTFSYVASHKSHVMLPPLSLSISIPRNGTSVCFATVMLVGDCGDVHIVWWWVWVLMKGNKSMADFWQ